MQPLYLQYKFVRDKKKTNWLRARPLVPRPLTRQRVPPTHPLLTTTITTKIYAGFYYSPRRPPPCRCRHLISIPVAEREGVVMLRSGRRQRRVASRPSAPDAIGGTRTRGQGRRVSLDGRVDLQKSRFETLAIMASGERVTGI